MERDGEIVGMERWRFDRIEVNRTSSPLEEEIKK